MPLPLDLLKHHLSTVFIETGSNRGDGIQTALDAGFSCIYSCDVEAFSYGWCSHRFRELNTVVGLFHSDSRNFLNYVMPRLKSRATFWLDAHWCGGNGEMQGQDEAEEDECPLLGELKVISTHELKNHTIMIDDVRLMGVQEGFPTRKRVQAALKKINPHYELELFDSPDFEKDILVAYDPRKQSH